MLKILIVEDEEAISDLIRIHLTRAGYVCEQAFDGKEGADKICSKHYDLVLLDIMLPKISGYELLDYVIEKVKETGIRVAIHTHGPDGAAFPDIRTVVEKVGDPSLGIGCCMDLGHTYRSGFDAAKDIRKYGKWIYDIHIKDETDASKSGQTWEMGRGKMDFVKIIKALRKIGYSGKISIEFEKNGSNPHPGIAESVGYLRGIMDATE